ncbi:hypothetical protein BGW80DRAFT_1561506 [Lactifluus volemus]|nr:hypothetical protein BGW80DRAFT_1561506 [Lactifluus volemus]
MVAARFDEPSQLISHVLSSSQSRSTDMPRRHSPSNTSSKIRKIGKRMRGRISSRVTICSLPDDVLLDIFEFSLLDPGELRARTWPKLVHVCQRWRYIVFASPLRLDLRLLCTARTPLRRTLDVWPPLPIQIQCFSVYPRDEDNVIAAFERPNHVCSILLHEIRIPLEHLVAAMQEPFPELGYLSLRMKRPDGAVPALPTTFLGGSAPRLRSLHLRHIPFPTLPRLLLSSNDLVHLSLSRIPHNGYISPEAMAMCISALTSLTKLSITFLSPTSRPDPTTRRRPPLTRAVLPALTNLYFCGVSEYLEDLMSRIEAPLLDVMKITFFNQLVFDIQQLSWFIGHAPALISCDTAYTLISHSSALMGFSSMRRPSQFLRFEIPGRGVDWQVSSVAQIFSQLLIMSSIETLYIDDFLDLSSSSSTLQDVMDETQWLEFFNPFTAVRTLYIRSQTMQSHVVSALRGLGGESATQVLPALRMLHVPGYWASGFDQDNVWPFIIARRQSDHPVFVLGGRVMK